MIARPDPVTVAGWLGYLLAVGLLGATLWKRVAEYDAAQKRLEAMRRQHDP